MIRSSSPYFSNSPYLNAQRPRVPATTQPVGSGATQATAAPSGGGAPVAATAQPSGGGMVSSMGLKIQSLFNGDWLNTGASLAHLWNKVGNAAYQGGMALQSSADGIIGGFKSFDLNGIFSSSKGLVTGSMEFAKKSAMFEGGISLVMNGYSLVKGNIDFKTFGTRVTGDTLGGLAGGAGGAIAGAVGLSVLGAFGLTGAVATIGGALVGMVGYNLAERAFRRTTIFNGIVNTVHDSL